MIHITSIGERTVLAIKAGHDTNEKLYAILGGSPQRMGSRVAKLRKQGLVRSHKVPAANGSTNNQPLTYTLLDKEYQVNDAFLKQPKTGIKPSKTYAGMGENVFDNLNSYLYPEKR